MKHRDLLSVFDDYIVTTGFTKEFGQSFYETPLTLMGDLVILGIIYVLIETTNQSVKK